MKSNSIIVENEIMDLYYRGVTLSKISKLTNISIKRIGEFLKGKGIIIRRSLCWRLDWQKISSEYLDGKTPTELAKEYGINYKTVISTLKTIGVKIRSRKESTFKGEKHHFWNGGRTLSDKGYLIENINGKPLHRTILENHLNIDLKNEEVIHHVDGNKLNNSIDNLVVMDWCSHTRFHMFLKHKKLIPSQENLDKFCKNIKYKYYRFSEDDFKKAVKKLNLKCLVDGCEELPAVLNFCYKHYSCFKHYKSKMLKGQVSTTKDNNFKKFLDKLENNHA